MFNAITEFLDRMFVVLRDLGNGQQDAIAIGSIVVGILFAYVGYLFFRYVLGLAGFVAGAYLGMTLFYWIPLVQDSGTIGQIIFAVLLGAIGAAIFYMVFFQLGMFVFGAGGAIWLGMIFVPPMGGEDDLRLLVILALGFTGGIVTFFFKRPLIIVVTGAVGAASFTLGLGHFMNWPFSVTNVNVGQMISGSFYRDILLLSDGTWIIVATAGVFLTGIVTQFATPKKLKPEEDR